MKTKCDTTMLGRIFGHKFFYSAIMAGFTTETEFCVRCGYDPRRPETGRT